VVINGDILRKEMRQLDLDEMELKATREMKAINKIVAGDEKTADEMFEELRIYRN
jgi:hypothetical protein